MALIPPGVMPWLKWGAVALLIAGSAAITGSLVNSHWKEKELLRNVTDLKAMVKNAQENAAINAQWAQQFADISQRAVNQQRNRDQTYEKTMADYRAGTKRLRSQFDCYRNMSRAAASGQSTDGAGNCGLSDADVQFLVQFGREGNRLRDKVNNLQDVIRSIQNPKK